MVLVRSWVLGVRVGQTRGMVVEVLKEDAMSQVIVEIRAAEGGDDARLLVRDHLAAYVKAAERSGL